MDRGRSIVDSVVTILLVSMATLPAAESQATNCSNTTEFDLCFLIDRSGSICDADPNFNFSNPNHVTCNNWKFAVDFVYDFVSNISIGPHDVQVAVVIFDDDAQLMWNLSRYLDQTDLLDAIKNNLIYVKGMTTNTQAGLDLMAEQVFNAVDRPKAMKTAIIITDGKPTNLTETWKAIERVHSLNITTFVVGVTNKIDEETLKRLSSPPQQENITYFIASTYSSIDTVRTLILGQTCLLTTTTTLATTTTTTTTTSTTTTTTTSSTSITTSTVSPGLPSTSATPSTTSTIVPAVSNVTLPTSNLSTTNAALSATSSATLPSNNLSVTSTSASLPTPPTDPSSQWNSPTSYTTSATTTTGNISTVISNFTVSTTSPEPTNSTTTPITGSGGTPTNTSLPTTTPTTGYGEGTQNTSLGSPRPEMNETSQDADGQFYFSSVDPLRGPIAGGTAVTINGTWPSENINVTAVYIGNRYKGYIEEIISLRGLDQVIFTTPPADEVIDNLPVVVEFSSSSSDSSNYSSFNISTDRNFSYSYNPRLWEMFPRQHLVSGGTTLTCVGSNLTSVVYPWIQATVEICMNGQRVCSRTVRTKPCKVRAVQNKEYPTEMVCIMPQIDLPEVFLDILDSITVPSNLTLNLTYRAKRDVDSTDNVWLLKLSASPGIVQSLTGPNGRDTANIYLRFLLDGYRGNDDLNKALQDTRFYFVTAPEMNSSHEVIYFDPEEEERPISIMGKHLMRGCGKEHYVVRLGKGNCSINRLTDNQLTCTPPKSAPQNTHEFDYKFCDQRFTIIVSIGEKTYFYRCLEYSGPPPGCPADCWNNSNCSWKWIRIVLIVGLVIGLVLLLLVIILIICLIVVCARSRKLPKEATGISNTPSVGMIPPEESTEYLFSFPG